METSLENLTKTITFTIKKKFLTEAVDNFDLSMGTIFKPFPVTSLAEITPPKLNTFYKGQSIEIGLSFELESNPSPKIVYCKIQNIGKKYNNENDPIDPYTMWENIFSTSTGTTTIAPDGSLYIKATANTPNVLKMSVVDDVSKDYFISYSIIFSLKMKLNGNAFKDYYFIIDPLAKISSNHPPALK